MPTALITGVGGQDGSYLSEFLLDKGYRVVGTVPDDDPVNIDRIRHLLDRIEVVQDDLLNQERIESDLSRTPTRRSVQLRCQLGPRGIVPAAHPGHHGARDGRHADPRGDPEGHPEGPVLPGLQQRDLRETGRGSAIGDDTLPPAQPVRRLESVRSPDDDDVPRKLRPVSPAPASFTTTKARDAARSSSPGRSPWLPQRSSWGLRRSCASETWMRAATGDSREITCGPCG